MKITKRVKNYFTEEPKQSFWFWAFITLLIFRYATPMVLMLLVPLQIGLISPEIDINYQDISINIAENLVEPLETLNEAGSKIGEDHPIISKVVFYTLSYFIYIIWVAMFCLVINLFRYFISWIIRKYKR